MATKYQSWTKRQLIEELGKRDKKEAIEAEIWKIRTDNGCRDNFPFGHQAALCAADIEMFLIDKKWDKGVRYYHDVKGRRHKGYATKRSIGRDLGSNPNG